MIENNESKRSKWLQYGVYAASAYAVIEIIITVMLAYSKMSPGENYTLAYGNAFLHIIGFTYFESILKIRVSFYIFSGSALVNIFLFFLIGSIIGFFHKYTASLSQKTFRAIFPLLISVGLMLLFQFALSGPYPARCKYFDNSSHCWQEVALTFNDPTYCEKENTACSMNVISKAKDEKVCRNITDPDSRFYCLLEKAYKPEVCNKIDDNTKRDDCFVVLSAAMCPGLFCEFIENTQKRETCENFTEEKIEGAKIYFECPPRPVPNEFFPE